MLKMEEYPLFRFFLFLDQKLTIVEQSCTLQGHFSFKLVLTTMMIINIYGIK